MSEKLIFPIGFDLEEGVEAASKEWKSTYQKQLQKAIDDKPLKVKIDFESKGIDTKEFKQWMALSREAEKLERERIKNAKEWQKVADQAAMAETRRANVTNESNARIERANRKAEASEKRKSDAVERTNAAYNSQSTYLSRLFTRMAAYFSIHQAFSFLRNIRAVTAEFELQRVALGALIQDMYKADTIFEQIKEAAVRSPFEVKDLVKFTKQLAAYGVESEDLFDTMDGLADISAGLGAEMDRLVLAFGQIKAAGVLKGTELRQLTETGLPMVELLADYYSTLRGEVVSTSQVFDMISNKEIPFEAVQDILEDLTSEGGRFFEMQEKQADTLHGRWTNLKDALSIMFDEMGRSEEVQALMNGLIDGTKWLAENWRLIWQQVKILILTFGGLKASQAILNGIFVSTTRAEQATRRHEVAVKRLAIARTANNKAMVINARYTALVTSLQKKAATSTNILTRAVTRLGAVILANPVAALMTLASVLSFFAIKNKAAEASIESLEDKQRAYAKEAVENVEVQVALFKRLANEVVKYNDGSERQNAALRKLKDRFGDMIPEYQLTAEHLREVSKEANGSADAFNNMANSLQNVMHERIRTKLIEDRYKEVEDKFKEVYDKASGGAFQFAKEFGEMERRVLGGEYWETVWLEWRKTMEGASAVLTYSKWWENRLSDRGEKFLQNLGAYYGQKTTYTWKQILDALNAGKIAPEDYDLLLGGIIGTEGVQDIESLKEYLRLLGTVESDVNKIMRDFKSFNKEFSEVNDVIIKARQDLKGLDEVGGLNAEQVAENYAKEMSKIEQDVVKGLFDTLDDATKQQLPQRLLDEVEDGRATIGRLYRSIFDGKLYDVQLPDSFLYGLEEAKTLFGEFDTDWKRFIADQQDFVKSGKVVAFDEMQIKNFTSLHEAVKTTSEEYDNLSNRLKELKTIQSSWKDKDRKWKFDNADAVVVTEEKIEKIEARMKLLEKIMDKYGRLGKEEDKRDPVKERLSLLKDEISTVEKIYKEYQSLRKYMGEAEAQASIEKMFGNVPFEILDMATSVEEMRAQLEKAKDEAKRLGDDKLVLDIEYKLGKLDIDESKRKFEQNMRKLSDELSRTKTAKEFFDRMLGMTGDKELSATLTMSVYGTTGDDLKQAMVKQVLEAFKGVDISDAVSGLTIDYNKLETYIKDLPDEQQKTARSIVENWRKTNQDIISDIYKTYEDFLTYEERKTKVVEKENAERMRIINSGLPMDEQEKLVRASENREKKALGDIAIEEFKASEDWAKSFEDLENLATPTIERLMSKLKEFIDLNKKDLTPEQVKTLTNEYKKLYDGLITRNPFQALTDGIKEYKIALQDVETAKVNVETARANVQTTQEELRVATERKAIAEQNFRTSSDTLRAGQEYAEAIRVYNEAAQNASKAEQELSDAERNQTDAMDNQRKAYTKIGKSLGDMSNKFSQAEQLIQSFTETLGISEDSDFGAFLNGMAESFGGVAKAIAFAQLAMQLFDGTIRTFLTSNPIGWILLIVSAIISAVQAIMNARINRINKEIEALEDKLDNLEYAYDRLQKSAEKAFGTEYIQNYNRQLANLEAQVEAYEKQLDLERSKGKKADEEKIKEYQEQIRDTKDAIEDMYGSLSEHFLGTDLTSAARDFASAWIDAYKEFANTTDAMKAKFQEMIQNMIVESLIAKVMERALKPVFDMVDNMGDSDFYSNSFWSQLMTEMNKATENGVVGAQNIMGILESIGINLRDTGTGLTGISRDIASASEESILGLAAGINTQNFYISQVPTKLDTIIGLLRGGSAVVDSGVNVQDLITIQNQFLSHLPTIAQNTAETVARCERAAVACESMASKLGSVIKPKGTTSTHSVNVTIGS